MAQIFIVPISTSNEIRSFGLISGPHGPKRKVKCFKNDFNNLCKICDPPREFG